MPADVQEVFSLWDDEGDGKIDAADIGTVTRALGHKPTNALVDKVAGKKFERNEKRLSFEEFKPMYEAIVKDKKEGTAADFTEALKVFDKDQVGKVFGSELKHLLAGLGEKLAMDQVNDFIEGMADADDQIKIEDFVKKVCSGPPGDVAE